MDGKAELIRRICQVSDENPEFLVNFSQDELQDYVQHLEEMDNAVHEQTPSCCHN
jgi:hypothetical protein